MPKACSSIRLLPLLAIVAVAARRSVADQVTPDLVPSDHAQKVATEKKSLAEDDSQARKQTDPTAMEELSEWSNATGKALKILVMSFNAGEAEAKDAGIKEQHAILLAAMSARLAEAKHPDVIVMGSQEFQKGMFPLKYFMESIPQVSKEYVYVNPKHNKTRLTGVTKLGGSDVRTSIEVAMKRSLFDEAQSDLVTGFRQRFYGKTVGIQKKGTKGVVSIKVPIQGWGGGGLRLAGTHLDTKEALENLQVIGGLLAQHDPDGAVPTILMGDYNTRLFVANPKAGADGSCADPGPIKEMFKISKTFTAEAFMAASHIPDVVGALTTSVSAGTGKNIAVQIPHPPVVGGYIVPTYKYNGCSPPSTPCTAAHAMSDFKNMFTCNFKKGPVSLGYLDYFAVIFDQDKYGVALQGALSWDGMPLSDHAFVTGVVTVMRK